ncbi:AraC-type DNA-binding protein [Paenibacillus sp. UNCCL117]|uniref:AraC family transcriptional regulator n=1 Tax=unclassified Paenibacillus TaxID=185978 RepID=UPI00088875CD|nr:MULTISPECIES: AraC family transcriptional regulator [unclassified Paenibacillus]SDD01645.1 AraC-type DNA-binding protein [Paenibacillus sp. cl123]SFW32639.1 AraC-type DNA-binding protein [Paenibacillus sp. UNCCL117]
MAEQSLFQAGLLEGDYHPRVRAYYFKQWISFQMAFHQHADTEIMYIISGHCRVDLQQGKHIERVLLKKGEFILLNADIPHRLIVEDGLPCRMLNIEFRFEPCRPDDPFPSVRLLSAQDEPLGRLLAAGLAHIVLRDPDEVYHLLKSLVLELDGKDKNSRLLIRLQMMQLLIRIARLQRSAEDSRQPHADYYIRQCVEFMHHNYDRDIRVKDIAAAVSLHPGYLHRIFRTQTGRSLTGYLTDLRIEKAKMLLHTDIPILDVADYVGVGSRQYFHSLFKKQTGLTPTEFRRSIRAEARVPERSDDF